MLNSIIRKVMKDPAFSDSPPVLIDVGASGRVHSRWKKLAPYSVCLAFDADDRKFGFTEKTDSGYKKLLVFHSLVFPEKKESVDFYLTKSPYCSSTLHPDNEELSEYAFSYKFDVEKTVQLPAVTLTEALEKSGFGYVDWFKTDSQGIDLALFRSLGEKVIDSTLVAELEPGLIDAYRGENKMYEVIGYFDKKDFWLAAMTVKGFPRIKDVHTASIAGKGLRAKLTAFSQKQSPGWTELFFLNKLRKQDSRRSLLLGWVIAMTEKQYGFALDTAIKGTGKYGDEVFTEMADAAKKAIRRNMLALKFVPFIFKKIQSLLSGY